MLLCCALARPATGRADDAGAEAAQRHFELGRALYEAKKYDSACREFDSARKALALPALEYDLARCEERRERWGLAAEAYERYLARAPASDADTIAEVQARVQTLRDRVKESEQRSLRIVGISLAAGALAAIAAGTGGYLSAWSDYQAERRACMAQPCTEADYAGLAHQVHTAQIVGATLWTIGGAAALADLGVWIVYTRGGAQRRAVSLAPLPNGVMLSGAF